MSTEKAIVKNDDKLSRMKKLAKKIENSSNFFKELDTVEKKRFINIVDGLREDTNNELTDTEYEGISKMIYFCDEFERLFSNQGLENADTDMLEIYRKMKTQITIFLKDYREGKRATPSSIKVIQNYLIKISKTVDEIDESQFDENATVEIIDVEPEEKSE